MKRPVRIILYIIGAIILLLAIMGSAEEPLDSVWRVVRDPTT